MGIKIRPFRITDYLQIREILIAADLEPPIEIADICGVCLVAEEAVGLEDDELVGVIWALTGQSTQGYVEYFAIRHKTSTLKAGQVGIKLIEHLFTVLRMQGIKRITFAVKDSDPVMQEMAERYGAKKLGGVVHYRKEL